MHHNLKRVTIVALVLCLSSVAAVFAPVSITRTGNAFAWTTEDPAFDTCSNISTTALNDWWVNSPYFGLGFYVGGPNLGYGCTVPTASWITAADANAAPDFLQWYLIPAWVGAQAPNTCNPSGGPYGYTISPGTSTQQGINDAGNTISALNNVGFPIWTSVALDMEGYTSTAWCNSVVDAYINGWVWKMRGSNYHPIVYGSESSTIASIAALVNNPNQNQPDDVWMACWYTPGYSCPANTVWNMPDVANDLWVFDQRHHQWQGVNPPGSRSPLCEKYGTDVSDKLQIDRDSSDGDATYGQSIWMNEHVQEGNSYSEDPSTATGGELTVTC